MSYLSLFHLRAYLELDREELFFINQASIREQLAVKLTKENYIQRGKSFSADEIFRFLDQLSDPRQVVFDQWILAHTSLRKLLLEGELTQYVPDKSIQGHTYFAAFIDFCSPYVLSGLLSFISGEGTQNRVKIASYIPLLTENAQWNIQEKLVIHAEKQFEKLPLHKAQNIEEQRIYVKELYSNEQIEWMNFLTKSFYSYKISFIEKTIDSFQKFNLPIQVIAWISGQLKKLSLNPEHQKKVEEIYVSIKRNDGLYYSPKAIEKKNKKLFKKGLIFTLIIGVVLFVIVISKEFFTPLSSKDKVQTSSSFTQFTKQERMELDSLIRSINGTQSKDTIGVKEYLSYLHLTPVEVQLQLRKPFKNKLVEKYILKCLERYDTKQKGEKHSCFPYTRDQLKELNVSPFRPLKELSKKNKMFLKNTSGYQIQVLLFKNREKKPVYFGFVEEEDSISFSFDPEYSAIFIPGKDFGEIHSLSADQAYVKRNFCTMDPFYYSNLFQVYSFRKINEKKVRIQFNESRNHEFYMIDFYQSLEVIE